MAESRGSASGGLGQSPKDVRRSARVNFKNSPVDCFGKRDALQERASLKITLISAKRRPYNMIPYIYGDVKRFFLDIPYNFYAQNVSFIADFFIIYSKFALLVDFLW